ncbi:MAG TPA: insulinase family protein [Persephonella sp.]|nr:insulinase family protein [Hydrogenothermaceae bacterium]HIQ24809.1 insulinase family protein [Persephonella sp.]
MDNGVKTLKYLIVFLSLTFNLAIAGGNEVIKHILPNKATILYKETSGKGIISGVIFIKGGSVEDPKGKKGLNHLLFKMLLKRTENLTGLEINKVFEDSGGHISTSSGEEFSTIEFAIKLEDFQNGMNVLKEVLYKPVFEKEKLKQEINNTIAQINAKKEEGFSYALDELRKEIYKNTPYETSPLGIPEDLKNITVKDLKERHKQILQGGRFIISIVGDLPYKEVEPILNDVFGKLENKNYQYKKVNIKISKANKKEINREGAQSTIVVAYNAPKAREEGYFAFKVLNSILGNGFTSRLFQELREKRGLAYAVGSFYPSKINVGNMFAYIGTAPEKTEKSLNGIIDVVNSIKNGITQEELEIAKEKLIGHFLLDSQTREKQAFYLGFFETIGLGYETFNKYVEKIQSVKEKQVLNVYNKYIPEGYFAVIVKP